MMFVDASAIIAIIAREEDAASLAVRLDQGTEPYTSPVAIFEAVMGLALIARAAPSTVAPAVEQFLAEAGIATMPLDADVARAAIDAFERFGRGRHSAALNLGDCFAYACARRLDASLLCKGNDFPRTDVVIA